MKSATARRVAPAPRPDPTFYPIEGNRGRDSLQVAIIGELRPLVARWVESRCKRAFVGANQFIYYKQFHPECVVDPDVYVLPGVDPDQRIANWKVWETGIVPSFALQVICSPDPDREYHRAIRKYPELGVPELILFDPDHALGRDRVRWMRYRNTRRHGFVQVEASNAARLRSYVLGCFLCAVGEGDDVRLRLAPTAS